MTLRALCGSLIVCGFPGPALDARTREALQKGERGGIILFKRNIPSVDAARAICTDALSTNTLAPLIGVDQEGGRVARLPSPFLKLPPMRSLAKRGEPFVRRTARLLGSELRAVGFNLDFSPVLDVDSNPANPIIGDRAFSADPALVAELAVAFGTELQAAGIHACGKHFPGHGDTTKDSHLELPHVSSSEESLRRTELVPFAAACRSKLATMMTAHVVYDALDPDIPATLSSKIATGILRNELGFEGVLFSDDLEMRALADRMPIRESAVRAIRAGCDALLVCEKWELAEEALEALIREAERESEFQNRIQEAATRVQTLRQRIEPHAGAGDPSAVHALEAEIAAEPA
jgi:beta-N-acetylhexosaminidase